MGKSVFLKLVAAFVALFVVIVASSWMSGTRLDLSDNGLYTLSEGTETILAELEHPVTIDYYFSEQATSQLPALRTYAKRVEELLLEYQGKGQGKVSVRVIDPVAFSEAEDQAALSGLQSVPGGARGDEIYFGLVAKNEAGDEEVIPFIQPDKEAFLEYDLTRLISALSRERAPRIGIYAGVDIQGGVDMMTRQPTQEWAALQYIEDNFELEWIADDALSIEGVDALLVIAPQNLSDSLLFAIDQYVLGGGKLLLFVDPYVETMAGLGGVPSVQSSNLTPLLEAWGVDYDPSSFVMDYDNSMVVSLGQGGQSVRHLGLLSLLPDAFSADDIALFGLESINFSSVGSLTPLEGATTKFASLIESSAQSALKSVDVLPTLQDPSSLITDFVPTEQQYTLAARISGPATTAFSEGVELEPNPQAMPEGGAETNANDGSDGELDDQTGLLAPKTILPEATSSEDIRVMVVADTDILSDRLWVQVQNFFGQQLVTPWADNGTLLLNSLENLSGDVALISIRSQGRYSRPFERVDALRRDAEERFRAQQELLEMELSATEDNLVALEQARDSADLALFSPEQEAELVKFQEQKLQIRKQLRDVQHQLDQDIEALGTRLKIINILLIPALICIVALLFSIRQRRNQARR